MHFSVSEITHKYLQMSWLLNTNEITRLQFELTNYCNAHCPQCARCNYYERDWEKETNSNNTPYPLGINNAHLDLDAYKRIIDGDKWEKLGSVHYCGNYDEPTIHPHVVEMASHTLETINDRSVKSNKIQVTISTNGGTRNPEWWSELGRIGKFYRSGIRVIWGIDGWKDTNHLYRRGVKWEQLEANFRAWNHHTRSSGPITSEWQFIVFEHNKHQLQWAKDNWKKLGFNRFKVIYSKRPDADKLERPMKENKRASIYKDSHMINNVAYKPKQDSKITELNSKITELNPKITELNSENTSIKSKNPSFSVAGKINELNKPKKEKLCFDTEGYDANKKPIICKATRSGSSIGRSLYVSSRGYVMPCCWMGTDNDMKEAAHTFAKGLDPEIHSIYNYNTMSDVLNSPYFSRLAESIAQQPNQTCITHCKSQTVDYGNARVERY